MDNAIFFTTAHSCLLVLNRKNLALSEVCNQFNITSWYIMLTATKEDVLCSDTFPKLFSPSHLHVEIFVALCVQG